MSDLFALGFAAGFLKQAELRKDVELQAHQEDALRRSKDSGGMILNWGLGSGKTIGSLAIAEEKGGNILVVVPAALRENFHKELRKSVEPKRHKAYTVLSYEAFKKDPEGWVAKVKPNVMIADEFHRLRNPQPREPFEKIRSKVPFMLGLTGSLINNRPEEVVSLANLAAGKPVFPSIEEFKRRHLSEERVDPGFFGRLQGAKPGIKETIVRKGSLGEALSGVVHRFAGDEVYQAHMPKVVERRVDVVMSKEQEALYKAVISANPGLAYKLRKNLPPSKSELKDMNAFLTAARQVLNEPQSYSTKPIESPKFKAMLGDLKDEAAKDKNFKAVIYSNFLESGVTPLVNQLNAAGISSAAFVGGLSDKKRREMVEKFNKGEIKVLGLSPAGGEGLDLKGVKQVKLTEEHWNPERGRQAVGRSTRFKSHEHLPEAERTVDVARYMAVHPGPGAFGRLLGAKRDMSADEWIDARRREKLDLNAQVISSIPAFRSKAAAARGELLEIPKEAMLVPAHGLRAAKKGVVMAEAYALAQKRIPRTGSSLARQGFEVGSDAANRTWAPAGGAVRRGGGAPQSQMERLRELLEA